MKKIINRLISDAVVGADRYNKDGSTWLIFTDSKKWVIELTKEGTLWYNYNFFKNIFYYASLNVVEDQHYITKWVEDNIINGVKRTFDESCTFLNIVEDTIRNGVKHTNLQQWLSVVAVENTIQNGVKHTRYPLNDNSMNVEDTIQTGVKETTGIPEYLQSGIEDTIMNGIKETLPQPFHTDDIIEDIVESGVKETKPMDNWYSSGRIIDLFIDGSVKETIKKDDKL